MTVKKKLMVYAIAAMAFFAGGVAQATIINSTVPAFGIDYNFFSFGGGNLSIAVNGISLSDPEINLFVDDGSPIGGLTGGFLANDDDSGGAFNSLLNVVLTPGNFVLAIGEFANTETESRTGIATTPNADGTYQAIYTPDVMLTAVRNSRDDIGFSNPVPEPATLALFAIALAGFGVARRRVH